MFPEWHHAVPESAYFKVPETLKTFRMYSTSRYAPCATRLIPRLHGVGASMWNFSECRGIAEKCWKSLHIIFHFHTMEMSRRPYGDCGVSTEIPRSVIAFLRGSSWRSTARSRRVHGVSTACTPRVKSGHRARTARPHRAGDVPYFFFKTARRYLRTRRCGSESDSVTHTFDIRKLK